jgi:hypothetical protein
VSKTAAVGQPAHPAAAANVWTLLEVDVEPEQTGLVTTNELDAGR